MTVLKDIPYGEHEACKPDIYKPDVANGDWLVFSHGGGLERGARTDNAAAFQALALKGVTVASAGYRLYPTAKYPAFIEDAASAVAFCFFQKEKPRRIFAAGSSAGAYLAMMLRFDAKYLLAHGINSCDINGYIFNAGQPTTHFNVLKARGMDTRRIVVDDAAPLYHIAESAAWPPMLLLVAESDIPCRLEQTQQLCASMRQFGCPESQIRYRVMVGYGHVGYDDAADESGGNVLAAFIIAFMEGM